MKLAYIFLLAFYTTITYSQNVKKLIKEAEAKTEANDLPGALSLYNRIITLTPEDAEMYLDRANVNFWLENYNEAMDDHNKTIELKPSSAKYFYERAFFFQNVYQFDYALLDCNKALELPVEDEKTLSRIYTIRANSKKFMGDYEGSHKDFQEALKHKPEAGTEITCLSGDSSVLAKLGRRDEGIAALRLLIKKYPKFTGGYLNLAFQLGEAGRYDEAIKISDSALETIEKAKRNDDQTYNAHKKVKVEDNNGEIPVIYNNRGYAKYKLGLHDEALKDINTSIGLLPDNSYAYRNRALVYLAINKTDLACEDISKSISLNFTKSYGPEMEQLKQQHCK